ncbi:MAG: chloride channel protein [Oscillospiraceae bacterium]|nr:chloride channel protein [Oscillospiraceae bacterium]
MATSEKTEKTIKSRMLFLLAAVFLGAVAGGVVWLFLKAMELGIAFIWDFLPSRFEISYYPLLICAAGGIIIGLWRKFFGDYPEDFEEVIKVIKETKRYDSRLVFVLFVSALLPLVFGGSIGPEAGLVGIIAALCTWVGDRFKHIFKEMKELAQIGVSATLSVLFTAPLFGFLTQVEDEGENNSFPGRSKLIVYFAAIFGGFGIFMLLIFLFGGGLYFERFEEAVTGRLEMIFFVPLAVFGAVAGCFYHYAGKLTLKILKPLNRLRIVSSLTGGILLGLCGMFIPLVIFTGEVQMGELTQTWTDMTPVFLLGVGFLKLLLTNICLGTGWRGGHILPIIFAGVSFGYAASHLFGVDSIFAIAVITTALCGAIMKKPLAVIMVMLVFFSFKNIIALSLSAFIGAFLSLKNKKSIRKTQV